MGVVYPGGRKDLAFKGEAVETRIVQQITFANTSGVVPLFDVTGDVKVRLFCVVATSVASAIGCDAQVGIAADPDAIVPLTDVTLLSAREFWYDDSPEIEIETLEVERLYYLSDGNNIIMTLSAQADSGVLRWYCFWTPLSDDGAVTAP